MGEIKSEINNSNYCLCFCLTCICPWNHIDKQEFEFIVKQSIDKYKPAFINISKR
jgi:hypothetical protein